MGNDQPTPIQVHTALTYGFGHSAIFTENYGDYFVPYFRLEEAREDVTEGIYIEGGKTYLSALRNVEDVCMSSGRVMWLDLPPSNSEILVPTEGYAVCISTYM